MSDNPFAPPSGEPPQRPAQGAPDWEHPAYQQSPWGQDPYTTPPPGSRFVPRGLVAAGHTSAAGAWLFTVTCGIVDAAFDGGDPGLGLLLAFVFAGVLVTTFFVGLFMMFAGVVAAVPLMAIRWGERHERQGEALAEKAAVAHLGVAWLFAGYYLVRIALL